jgi:hypothetical protein
MKNTIGTPQMCELDTMRALMETTQEEPTYEVKLIVEEKRANLP